MAVLLAIVMPIWAFNVQAELGAEGTSCERAAAAIAGSFQHLQQTTPPTAGRHGTKIAIVIDDLGYNLQKGRSAVALPGAVTLAVLPHSPHGRVLAKLAHQAGREVMLHLPMSNVSGQALDQGALTDAMDQAVFTATLRENLNAIPHIRGVNNHMGSRLTQNGQSMRWLMRELKPRGLYFVDSRTSPHTIALQTATEYGLASLERNFFLDNERDCLHIARQFQLFLADARRTGQGLAIGHPYPETLQFLSAALPQLAALDVQLVPVSRLLPHTPSPSNTGSRPLDGFRDHVERLLPALGQE
ncbi:MAG: divergent polysaccharide deacetylase family protein [Cellvibrionaceae bacterium]